MSEVIRSQRINTARIKQVVNTCQEETTANHTRFGLCFPCSNKTEFKHSMDIK